MPDASTTRNSPRTAVLVVHGMGNQRPLKTVRQIADALYGNVPPPAGKPPHRWWTKLDREVTDVDLPVIVTDAIETASGSRIVEFHECYWASEMAESRLTAVPMWLFELIRKGPWAMPPRIMSLWFLFGGLLAFWMVSAVLVILQIMVDWLGLAPDVRRDAYLSWGVAAALCFFVMRGRGLALLAMVGGLLTTIQAARTGIWRLPLDDAVMRLGPSDWLTVAVLGLAAFLLLNWFFLLTVAGDAARYLRAAPSNIAVRRSIRAMAVSMLHRLHSAHWQGAPKYDRIIIVSHSLGTVVAYDMLRAYWAQVAPSLGDPYRLDRALVSAQDDLPHSDSRCPDPSVPVPPDGTWRAAWRHRARRLIRALDADVRTGKGVFKGKDPRRWIVSDFITLGSPLSQADFLLAEGTSTDALRASFARKTAEREFPTCPAPRSSDGNLTYSAGGQRLFHHGALFGLTRWTNLYFPVRGLLWGDLIGGPMQRLFGHGVEDVAVNGARNGGFVAHTAYWHSRAAYSFWADIGRRIRIVFPPRDADSQHYLIALRNAVDLYDA